MTGRWGGDICGFLFAMAAFHPPRKRQEWFKSSHTMTHVYSGSYVIRVLMQAISNITSYTDKYKYCLVTLKNGSRSYSFNILCVISTTSYDHSSNPKKSMDLNSVEKWLK